MIATAAACNSARTSPRARLDAVLRDLGVELVLATPEQSELDTSACAATTGTQCMRCALAAAPSDAAAEQLAAALTAAPASFIAAAGLRRVALCTKLDYAGDHDAPPGGTIDFARGALFVQASAFAGNARGVVQHELFHLFDLQVPSRDDAWLELHPKGFRYGGAPAEGFARDYGRTSIREDKATVYEAIITGELCARQDGILLAKARLVRARIAGAIGGDVTFVDELAPCVLDGR